MADGVGGRRAERVSNSSVSVLCITLDKEVQTVYEKEKHFNLMTVLATLPRLVMVLLNGYSLKVHIMFLKASVGANKAIGVVNYMEAEGNSDLRLNRLQTLILRYFNGLKAEVFFTKLLLSYSPSLEQMVIENRSGIDAKKGLRILTELMQFPRASTKAQ
ncbi:hypothetical protein LguiB_001710 [Lonicera macranthoides]